MKPGLGGQPGPYTPAGLSSGSQQAGRICAVAGQVQRDLQEQAAIHGDPFTAGPFDAAMLSTLAMATAFSSPQLGSDRLRVAGRAAIWATGLDFRIDRIARTRDEVDDVMRRCLAIAEGSPVEPGDGLGSLLADIRDELATVDGYSALRLVWQAELHRLLRGQAQEWDWRAASAPLTLEEYLADPDGFGVSFVFISHLAYTYKPPPQDDVAELLAAGRAVQRAIRLMNDLASYDRDRTWGDLNALLLPGVDRGALEHHIATYADRARSLIEPLRARHPEPAQYLDHQMEFCLGFYGVADFWGKP